MEVVVTELYYYVQRYLDPQYNIWMTSDPAIYGYMSQSKNGEGGIYNITNFNLYHYAGNNPVKYIDPNGMAYEDLRDLTDEEKEFVDDAFFTAFLNIGKLQDKTFFCF